jgi:hypothetical protein
VYLFGEGGQLACRSAAKNGTAKKQFDVTEILLKSIGAPIAQDFFALARKNPAQ